MRNVSKALGTMGVFAVALFLAGMPAGCDTSKSGLRSGSGGTAGSGGNAQGNGGAAGSGGAIGTGGTAGSTTNIGTAGSKGSGGDGTGGMGTGGVIKGGASGSTIVGTGGIGGAVTSGTGGRVQGSGGGTSTAGAGGTVKDGAAGNTVVSTGGMLKGGVDGGTIRGGAGGTGGAPPLDGGSPDVAPPKCSEVTTQVACDARDDCHSVFEDPGTCGCASPGCCARFNRCANGGYASCLGTTVCDMVEPFCDPPYVIAYSGLCYEGCVYQDDCALLPCPQAAPKDGSACSPSNGTCYYEDCASAGRSLATCVAGAWKVESAACGPFPCQAPNMEDGGLTCAAGQICVITTSTSFNVTPACEDQICGARPMSTDCIEGLTGNCSPKYGLGGVVVKCAMPVP